MKRFVLAILLCSAGLGVGVFVLSPKTFANVFGRAPAKENLIDALLALPAPPPPNPLEPAGQHDENFYDPKNPPPDNAPIEDLIDYWEHQSQQYRGVLYYLPRPSDRVIDRMLDDAQNDPGVVNRILNILPEDQHTADLVKQIYDLPATSKDEKGELRSWLTNNSNYFIDDLARSAKQLRDTGTYVNVSTQTAFLALTRHDFDDAKPIIDRLYNDQTQPVSKALATWALYRHALETNSPGDVDRYRGELMKMVENRGLPDGVRDMANDAIVREPDFPGRDEWCYSLFEDETLVNMQSFTMLTTMVMYQPPDKFVPKLVELLKSSNKNVRLAATRNLLVALDRSQDPEIIRALLPWLEDPKWLETSTDNNDRQRIVMYLQTNKMPESVPGLIAVLDEKQMRKVPDYSGVTSNGKFDRVANAMNAAANAMRAAAGSADSGDNRSSRNLARTAARLSDEGIAINAASNAEVPTKEEAFFPYREGAIRALAFQGDMRAAPELRRLLSTMPGQDYERAEVVRALFACNGFAVDEQVDALEYYAKRAVDLNMIEQTAVNTAVAYTSNSAPYPDASVTRPFNPADLRLTLGMMVASSRDVSDALARATVDRIEAHTKDDPQLAASLRRIVINWHGLAVSSLLLRDLKNDRAESGAVVRLLAERKLLREKLSGPVSDAHDGSPMAKGVTACILEDTNVNDAILDGEDPQAKIALLACGRLIRESLPLAKIAANLKSTNAELKTAAELYLESEDSPEARAIVLGLHEGEAKVMGATLFFKGKGDSGAADLMIANLFASVDGGSGVMPSQYGPAIASDDIEKTEQRLQKEVKENGELLGVYAYDSNFVRIYKDKAVFSWEDDPARAHERDLKADEFDRLKAFLTSRRVNEIKPFLGCSMADCGPAKELLMLSRNGGGRIFLHSSHKPEFFAGLERLFAEFRAEPSAIRYALSKDVSGLELLFADDDLDAQTVWKQGTDLRVVVSSKSVRAKVDEDLELMEAESANDNDEDADNDNNVAQPSMKSPIDKLRVKREYEGYAWRRIENGKLGAETAQPAGVDYIPLRDDLAVQAEQEQWKARAAGYEIRADESGLFKVARGKLVRMREGSFTNPVVSSNGRWVIVLQVKEDEGMWPLRINLLTNHEYKIDTADYGNLVPKAYIPALGKFLLAAQDYDEEGSGEGENDDADTTDAAPQSYYLLNPETDTLMAATGEMRPIAQQKFRPLQAASKANEFWAAIPNRDKNETLVGIYDSRLLNFKPLAKLPNIAFNSMDMWMDEAEGKLYFVYNGHLLSLPIKTIVGTTSPKR